jgi:hypothetical protein
MLFEAQTRIIRKPFWIRTQRLHKMIDLTLEVRLPQRSCRKIDFFVVRFHGSPKKTLPVGLQTSPAKKRLGQPLTG